MRTPQADFALAKLLTMYRKDVRTPQADFACKITDHVPQRYADAAGGFCLQNY
jgi:hypothetical protein